VGAGDGQESKDKHAETQAIHQDSLSVGGGKRNSSRVTVYFSLSVCWLLGSGPLAHYRLFGLNSKDWSILKDARIGNVSRDTRFARESAHAEAMVTVAEILVVVEDLIFLSKISGTARLMGVAVEPVDLQSLEQRVTESPPRAVILDLNHRSGSAVDALRTLKSNPATSGVPVVAFLSHVQTDLAAAARAAGCDVLLARSTFTRELPQLLEKYAGAEHPPSAEA
jgi:CheY-like chemotaxis protein